MADPDFSIADVLAWARTKPADQPYPYADSQNCAMGQFLCETGRANHPMVGGTEWNDIDASGRWSEARVYPSPELRAALVSGETFGGLAARLEALMVPA